MVRRVKLPIFIAVFAALHFSKTPVNTHQSTWRYHPRRLPVQLFW